METFYNRVCVCYPSFLTLESKNDYKNFKSYVKEFIIVIANLDLFDKNVIFCGLDSKEVTTRVMGMTYIAKLIKKYEKNPLNFFNNEKLRLESNLITLNLLNKAKPEYLSDRWNNYDDYC